MSFIIILEVFKFVGRKHKCVLYSRALCVSRIPCPPRACPCRHAVVLTCWQGKDVPAFLRFVNMICSFVCLGLTPKSAAQAPVFPARSGAPDDHRRVHRHHEHLQAVRAGQGRPQRHLHRRRHPQGPPRLHRQQVLPLRWRHRPDLRPQHRGLPDRPDRVHLHRPRPGAQKQVPPLIHPWSTACDDSQAHVAKMPGNCMAVHSLSGCNVAVLDAAGMSCSRRRSCWPSATPTSSAPSSIPTPPPAPSHGAFTNAALDHDSQCAASVWWSRDEAVAALHLSCPMHLSLEQHAPLTCSEYVTAGRPSTTRVGRARRWHP